MFFVFCIRFYHSWVLVAHALFFDLFFCPFLWLLFHDSQSSFSDVDKKSMGVIFYVFFKSIFDGLLEFIITLLFGEWHISDVNHEMDVSYL